MLLQDPKDNKDAVFDDQEVESNFVGFYDLLLTIDKRINPQLYD